MPRIPRIANQLSLYHPEFPYALIATHRLNGANQIAVSRAILGHARHYLKCLLVAPSLSNWKIKPMKVRLLPKILRRTRPTKAYVVVYEVPGRDREFMCFALPQVAPEAITF